MTAVCLRFEKKVAFLFTMCKLDMGHVPVSNHRKQIGKNLHMDPHFDLGMGT